MSVYLFGFFALFMIIRVPIAISISAASMVAIVMGSHIPLMVIIQRMYNAANSFPLMAIPFFILAGGIMETGGLSRRLINFGLTLVGPLRGGLGQVSVLTSMFFSAISGSAPATTAAIGGIMIPAMEKNGYDKSFAAALQAAAGSMGPIIPPSILFVTFGVVTDVSIGALFIAGAIPGILIGLSIMVVVYIEARRKNYVGTREGYDLRKIWQAFLKAFWVILMPVVVLGGIYGGFFTPTEAGIVSVVYGLFLGFIVYRDLKIRDLPGIFITCGLISAMIMFLIAGASGFSWIMARQRIPETIAASILSVASDPVVILIVINLILLIAGCLLDGNSATIILAPILLPIVKSFGMDPVHFGAMMTVNLCLGNATPPVGANLFVVCSLTKLKLEDLLGPLVKFLSATMVVLALVTYVPSVSLYLPRLMGLVK